MLLHIFSETFWWLSFTFMCLWKTEQITVFLFILQSESHNVHLVMLLCYGREWELSKAMHECSTLWLKSTILVVRIQRVCKKKIQSNSHTEERLQRYVYTLITRNEKRKGCKSTDRLFLFSDLLCDNFEWRKGCKFLIVLVLTVGSSTKLAAN